MASVAEYVQSNINSANSDRTQWQWNCIKIWGNFQHRATVEAATGSGKSRIGLHSIQLLRRNDLFRRVNIIVPTLVLQDQWRAQLKEWGIDEFTEVWVVNSYIKRDHQCDLLILDEIHRMAADTFSQLFEKTTYAFVLGLTATMRRLDGKHSILTQYAPICTKLSLAQARQKGWVADFREYWLGLTLNQKDQEHYNYLDEQLRKFFKVFEMDRGLAKSALVSENLRRGIGRRLRMEPHEVYLSAVNTFRYDRLIRSWIIKHPGKVDAANVLINSLERKTIAFGESIEAANKLSESLGRSSMCYHSKMEPIMKETFKDKEFKTEKGARKHAEKNGATYLFKHGKHIAQYRVMKKIAGKSLKAYILHKIANTQQLMSLITAKALNEGFDFPGAELGVTLSRYSSDTTYIQQTGRVARLCEGSKRPIMIHIYIKGTKDETWLRRAGMSAVGVVMLNSIEELLDHINRLENDQ